MSKFIAQGRVLLEARHLGSNLRAPACRSLWKEMFGYGWDISVAPGLAAFYAATGDLCITPANTTTSRGRSGYLAIRREGNGSTTCISHETVGLTPGKNRNNSPLRESNKAHALFETAHMALWYHFRGTAVCSRFVTLNLHYNKNIIKNINTLLLQQMIIMWHPIRFQGIF